MVGLKTKKMKKQSSASSTSSTSSTARSTATSRAPASASASSTTIGDLGDELLIEIFVRLPEHTSVMRGKSVSKRWLSILSCCSSDPRFVIEFLNHKKTLRYQPQLPWSFLSTMGMKTDDPASDSYFELFDSPKKFLNNFLPCQFKNKIKIVATFKDLILFVESFGTRMTRYYICNPFTKQWVCLPPCPWRHTHENWESWANLVCEEPYYNAQSSCLDYRYRVVVVYDIPKWHGGAVDPAFTIYKLMVYCSESLQWKRVELRASFTPDRSLEHWRNVMAHFEVLVCQGMLLCLRRHPYLVIFNPFDITHQTLDGTSVQARNLPTFHYGKFFSCGGQLMSVDIGRGDLFRMIIKELNDLNQVNPTWTYLFNPRFLYSNSIMGFGKPKRVIGMHPSRKTLVYVLNGKDEVILCDRKTYLLWSMGRLAPDHLESHLILERQCWPTPLPPHLPTSSS